MHRQQAVIDRVTQNEVIYLKAVITLPDLRDDICKHGNTNNGYVAAAIRKIAALAHWETRRQQPA